MSLSKNRPEYYISIDVEADGPCAGLNSMLQFGAVFYDADENVLAEYEANIREIEGAKPDLSTMRWWAEQDEKRPGLWANMMTDRVSATVAMQKFQDIVTDVSAKEKCAPVVVAYPALFDTSYTYYYCHRFLGSSPFGFSALDIKTMGMVVSKSSYHGSSKKNYPNNWFNPEFRHDHTALADARGQGYTFFRMLERAGELSIG